MASYREPTTRDWLTTLAAIGLCAAGAIIAAVILLSLFPRQGYLLGMVLALSLYFLVRWHAGFTAYRCLKCEHEFEITVLTDLVSPHGPGRGRAWKYLKCPRCNRRSMATVLVKTGV